MLSDWPGEYAHDSGCTNTHILVPDVVLCGRGDLLAAMLPELKPLAARVQCRPPGVEFCTKSPLRH